MIKRGNTARAKAGSEAVGTFGLVAVAGFFIVSGLLAYLNVRELNDDSMSVIRTHQVFIDLENLLSTMTNAETGQRGFILTGNEAYLEPYLNARSQLGDRLQEVRDLLKETPREEARLPEIESRITAKMDELAETIELRRTKGFSAALDVVQNNSGKAEMDAIRVDVGNIETDEKALREQRLQEMAGAYRTALISGILSGLLGMVLSGIVALLVRRNMAAAQRQEWLQQGHLGLSNAMLGQPNARQLSTNVLEYLTEFLGAHAAAIYVKQQEHFDLAATLGVPQDGALPLHFASGDGLLGRAALEVKAYVVDDVPDGYLTIGSALGRGNPRHLLVAPAVAEGVVTAVFELGMLHRIDERTLELVDRIREPIGVAVRAALDRTELQKLLEETQSQAEELRAQSEELRVSNEQLEEHGRALRESQARMELQQVEMEQTNAKLEAQAQLLLTQRDDLNRANDDLERQAEDLTRVSQ